MGNNVSQSLNNAALSTGGDYKLSAQFNPSKENSGKLNFNISKQTNKIDNVFFIA